MALVPGSFNFYIGRSGSFVTSMALAIQRADEDNLERIRKAFPQMVAAYKCKSWDEVPEGFESDTYNAEKIKTLW
jgi:DNA-binding FadR family transcriptional regulator